MPEQESFVIRGTKTLAGEIEVQGAKNAALPLLAATLLTKEPCIIENIPLIEDIFKMIEVLEELGAEVSWEGERTIKIKTAEVDPKKIPMGLVGCFRGSVLILGPLLARFRSCKLPPPGGCVIGARPIDTHLDAFQQAGFQVTIEDGLCVFKKPSAQKGGAASDIVLREFSVTATENIVLYASLQTGKTVIKIADQDYQMHEVSQVLQKMGTQVTLGPAHTVEISGKKQLKGFRHTLISDPIETGTFIIMALANRGTVLIKKAQLQFLDLLLKRLKDSGAQLKRVAEDEIKVLPSPRLKIDRIQSLPYPGIHSDIQPEIGVLVTQTKGPTLLHDPLFEGRLKYLEELNRMGADIIFCDPHRAIVNGPTQLHGINILSPDIRAGAALLTAGLIAKGETTMQNIYQIDRGYERIEERLQGLGADIKRVTS